MKYLKMNELKKNNQTYFKLNEKSKDIYFVNHYLTGFREYSISKFDDVNFERFVSPTKKVFVDFEF